MFKLNIIRTTAVIMNSEYLRRIQSNRLHLNTPQSLGFIVHEKWRNLINMWTMISVSICERQKTHPNKTFKPFPFPFWHLLFFRKRKCWSPNKNNLKVIYILCDLFLGSQFSYLLCVFIRIWSKENKKWDPSTACCCFPIINIKRLLWQSSNKIFIDRYDQYTHSITNKRDKYASAHWI